MPHPERSDAPRVLVAGLTSSAGKTTVASGLLGALRRRGLQTRAFKCGPDFLDPQVLSVAAGAPARNLDTWLVPEPTMREDFLRTCARGPGGVSIVEGAMGLMDGEEWGTSSLDVAKALDLPILLVLDASAASETLAVHARGARHLLGSRLKGVLVDRAGRGWHSSAVRRAIEEKAGVSVLGVLPWEPEATLPERHLGLVTPRTDPGGRLSRRVRRAAALVEEHVDLPSVLAIARGARPLPSPGEPLRWSGTLARSHPQVAVASDSAFCFVYPENLESLRAAGARLVEFSPVAGEGLPPGTDAIYLPGGFPELHAADLSRNDSLGREVRRWVRDGGPVYAECGGMMYLLDRLYDMQGRRHAMAGAFPGSARLSPRLGGFGYVEARLRQDVLLGKRRSRVHGHLYHHSVRVAPKGQAWALEVRRIAGGDPVGDGYFQGRAFASYLHVRFDQVPGFLARFLGNEAAPDGSGEGSTRLTGRRAEQKRR